MCQSMWKSFGDASEKHGVQYAGSYSDITPLLRGTSSSQVTHMAWGGGRGVAKVEISHDVVGGISVRCKTHLQVPDSRVRAWSQQSCLRRDKIQYFGKVLQNSPLTSHKMQLNRAILTMIRPCQ